VSERIKVHLLPLPNGGARPRDDASARDLVASAARDSDVSQLRTAVSTGAWLPLLAAELCRRWSIEGLGFLVQDLRILSPSESQAAAQAVDSLLTRLEAGDRPRESRGLGDQWHFVVSPADLTSVIAETAPTFEVDEAEGEETAFVQFLVGLQVAAHEASEAGHELLFWCTTEEGHGAA
jgi:hypothetical protein